MSHMHGLSSSLSDSSDFVTLTEVGPRDGLQAEPQIFSVETRVRFIQRLQAAGNQWIEVGSFVSPKAIPQMADTDRVYAQLGNPGQSKWMALVPNERGMHQALASGCEAIALFTAASESFTAKNINCTITESFERFKPVIALAKANRLHVRGYVSCVCGCPYEGKIAPSKVAEVARALYELGCHEISLGDTIGVGTPRAMQDVVCAVKEDVPIEALVIHCHDTYGQALANIYAALEVGVRRVDSSIAGLGGCPYAPGSSGNVATEDVVYMLHGLGMRTGLDLETLINIAAYVRDELNLPLRSKVSLARLK